MVCNRIQFRKTRKGSVIKTVKENYLRSDISCGLTSCDNCPDPGPLTSCSLESSLVPSPYIIVPSIDALLLQQDVFSEPTVDGILLLQTVCATIQRRSPRLHKLLRGWLGAGGETAPVGSDNKTAFVFVNEHHQQTWHESGVPNTLCHVATKWLTAHTAVPHLYLTHDEDAAERARNDGLEYVATVEEWVKSLSNADNLLDCLALVGQERSVGELTNYQPHLSLGEISVGVKSNRLFQGVFSAMRSGFTRGLVRCHDTDRTIQVTGLSAVNRAVHGDVVAVELVKKVVPTAEVVKEEEEETQMVSGEHILDEDDVQMETVVEGRAEGRVVGVVRRNWRPYCGVLQPSEFAGATQHLFIPADKRIPKIRLETRQVSRLRGQRLVVAVDSWPVTSRYPRGHFVRVIGTTGDKQAENELLLLEHNILTAKWSDAVLDCLPTLPWQWKLEEKREDLRHLTVCSVDPPGCTDIDDALHCRRLPDNTFECGVHIADVTHFMRPETALDEAAKERGTTVYLCDQRIDMIPDLLSGNLCSLRGGVERYAFSVIWIINKKGEVLSTRYTKSLIKSAAALTYAEAQVIIDEETRQDELATSLRALLKFAKIFNKRRLDAGALTLASAEIRFHLDSETAEPLDVQGKQQLETNSMVEEFMLLANCSVAEKIYSSFPDCAMLRRHPAPTVDSFALLSEAATSQGFKLEADTGKSLSHSLDSAVLPKNRYFNTMLRMIATRCMTQALYFCSGTETEPAFVHYGLAAPIYTHFTSPIRRYPDVMVHRLLALAIGADSSYPALLSRQTNMELALHLNQRNKQAREAARDSVALHTTIFFLNSPQVQDGYVMFVRERGVEVLIPKFGLEATLLLPEPFSYDEETRTHSAGDVSLSAFDPVTVYVSVEVSEAGRRHLKLALITPKVEGFSISPPKPKKLKKDTAAE